jgi:flavin reductase (DIM6/NTAB) family NADH-FMN oxidoreductase RutF
VPDEPADTVLVPDDDRFRTVLGHFATGVTIITAMDGETPCGLAANSSRIRRRPGRASSARAPLP